MSWIWTFFSIIFLLSFSGAQAQENLGRISGPSEAQILAEFDSRLSGIQFQAVEDQTYASSIPLLIGAPAFFSKIAVVLKKVSGEQLGSEEIIFSPNQKSVFEISLPLKFGEGEYAIQIGARNEDLLPVTRYRFVPRQIRIVRLQAKEGTQRVNFESGPPAAVSSPQPISSAPKRETRPPENQRRSSLFLEKSEVSDSRVRILGEVPEGIKFLVVEIKNLTGAYPSIFRDFELKSRKVDVNVFLKGGAGEYELNFFGASSVEMVQSSSTQLKASSLNLGNLIAKNFDRDPKGFFLDSSEPRNSVLNINGNVVEGEQRLLVRIAPLDSANKEICSQDGSLPCKTTSFMIKPGKVSKPIPLPGPGVYSVGVFIKSSGNQLFDLEKSYRVKNTDKNFWGVWIERANEKNGKILMRGRFFEDNIDLIFFAKKSSGSNTGKTTKQTLRVTGGVFSEVLDLNLGPGEYEIEVRKVEEGEFSVFENKFSVRSERSEAFDFLNSSQKINFGNEEFLEFIQDITGTAKVNAEVMPEMIEKGLKWISENIIYNEATIDLNEYQVFQTALGTLNLRKGKCLEYSRLSVAFLRGIGVPSRVVTGHSVPVGGGATKAKVIPEDAQSECTHKFWNHAWIQYRINDIWIDIEPATGGPIDRERYIPSPNTCPVE